MIWPGSAPTHAPAEHAPLAHTLPHVPQLSGSICKSMLQAGPSGGVPASPPPTGIGGVPASGGAIVLAATQRVPSNVYDGAHWSLTIESKHAGSASAMHA